jgi:GDP-L-fucose synthase
MIRKIHLANALNKQDWETIREDLNKRPVEGENGETEEGVILQLLLEYGITANTVALWGTGKPLREFLWSEEMADACVYIMEHVDFKDLAKDTDEVRNCHINIGTGKEISIKELAGLIAKTVGYNGEIIFNADKPDGAMRKLTDPSKLHSLGWRHRIDIEEGVRKLYDWYKE